MALEQQINSLDRGVRAPLAASAGLGRKAQAIAAEITRITQENIETGAKAAQKLREVRSLPEVIEIHTDLVKATFETFGAHYPRIAEIAASTPVELLQSYNQAFGAIAEGGKAAVQNAADKARSVVDQTSEAARQATERGEEALRDATEKGAEAVRDATEKTAEVARSTRR